MNINEAVREYLALHGARQIPARRRAISRAEMAKAIRGEFFSYLPAPKPRGARAKRAA